MLGCAMVKSFGLLLTGGLLGACGSAQESDPLVLLAKALTSRKVAVVDLTYRLDEQAPYWPEGRTETPFKAQIAGTYERNGLFARELEIPEHFGTHIDAPAHFNPQGWKVSEIPLERLIAPAIVIDVTEAASSQDEYRVTVEDIKNWEAKHGAAPSGAVALFRTGWGRRWPSQKDFMKQDAEGKLHFPYLSLEAARYVMSHMKPVGIGIDSPGIDRGDDHTYPLHHLTLDSNTYLLENVANLEALPETGTIVIVSPMKLTGGSGSPVRILGLVSKHGSN
ncbi:MAG TPA: cyclase family protein [Terriglobia bacterium]|jgi:kynurenine formamidase|nr:cyclase family protein [Terriglobia bacterium]